MAEEYSFDRSESTPIPSKFCEHCQKVVSKSTYYRHKLLYFDVYNQQWLSDMAVPGCCSTRNSTVSDESGRSNQSSPDGMDTNGW